ncbi:hypothetical protein ABZX75_24915 [Streptomyces sp. NPDC003038]|uniref:hypothetical protein n=1 Tax=unclassified Streptomyces TaxID=2593676 RepID=UPI0033A54F54
MMLWLVFGVAAAGKHGDSCETQPADVADACRAGNDVGTALGAGALVFLWMAGAVILGVLWLVTNPRAKDRRNTDTGEGNT